ncbi:MAG: pyridoxal phosphate-dependent aminotransferase [Alphaproteobacteria bacterium]|nr:pyridoxal phosphate-dependent aminotransferase [Alphaproteobacteria bacterium]
MTDQQPRTVRAAIASLEGSRIRQVAEANIGREDVIALWFGEPDLPTPDYIKRAAEAALADDQVFYAQNRGIPPLRETISEYSTGLIGRKIGTDRITVSASGMAGIMLVSQALVDNGDNVVIVGPLWPNCAGTVEVMGGEVRHVSLRPDETGRWRLDMNDVVDACDERTRAIYVNSPGNPTGWVMERDEQIEMLTVARERGIYVISDEVYVRLIYDRPRAPSFLDVAEDDDRVVVVNSFSKSWSMTGWRLGWLTHPPDLGPVFSKLNEFNVASPTTFVQHAGVVAMRDGEPFVAEMVERYRRNRDLVFQRLAAMPRVTLARPEGAFYAFFTVDGLTDSVAYAKQLIAETGVGMAPGRAFGEAGEGWLRLCFAADASTLSAALDRLEPAFS